MRRLRTISNLQSLAIFLVVLGHSLLPLNSTGMRPTVAQWAFHFVYSFHVPLFVFVSGFLFIYTNVNREIFYSRYILKKTKRLLLPYVVISTVAFVIKSASAAYAIRPVSLGFSDYMRGLFYPNENPIIYFWFLPMIFILLAVAPIIKSILRKNNIALSLSMLGLLLVVSVLDPLRLEVLSLRAASYHGVFFYLGSLTAYYFGNALQRFANYCTAFVLFAVLTAYAILSIDPGPAQPLIAILGIAFSMSFVSLVENLGVFDLIEGYYYQIFLLSWFPQVFFQMLYRSERIDYWLAASAMLLSGLYLPVVVTRLVERRLGSLSVLIGLEGRPRS